MKMPGTRRIASRYSLRQPYHFLGGHQVDEVRRCIWGFTRIPAVVRWYLISYKHLRGIPLIVIDQCSIASQLLRA